MNTYTGPTLRDYRESRLVTQRELAAHLGWAQRSTVSIVENKARVTELLGRRFVAAVDEIVAARRDAA